MSGGVDIFLFLSGFFVLGSQLRRIALGERTLVIEIWKRTARRLMPAAWLVVTVTVIAAVIIAPRRQLLEILQQGLSSAAYQENWWLINHGQAYGATASFLNPFQHFWSLSVQGQIFLIAPLLSLLAYWLLRTSRSTRLPRTIAGMAVVTVALFILALALVHQDQTSAYLSTVARAWQFALGGLVALSVPLITLSERVREVLGWVGLTLILLTGLVVDGQSTFPGLPALIPLAGATLVILAGTKPTLLGVDRVLGQRAISGMGTYAYGLYLWHWPVLALYLAHSNQGSVDALTGLLIAFASIGLAVVTHHLVEKPWQRPRSIQPASARSGRQPTSRRLALGMALTLALAGTTVTMLESNRIQSVRAAQAVLDPVRYPGARHVVDPIAYPTSNARALPDLSVPPEIVLNDDGPGGCGYFESEPDVVCRFASIATIAPSPDAPRIAIVGGSHAGQIRIPLVKEFEGRVSVREYIRAGCPFFAASSVDELNFTIPNAENCILWNQAVTADLLSDPPDLVIAVLSRASDDEKREFVPEAYVNGFALLDEIGIPTLAIRMYPTIDAEDWQCLIESKGLFADPVGIMG